MLRAIEDFDGSRADFADCLIGRIAESNGAEAVLTLDRDAGALPGYELV